MNTDARRKASAAYHAKRVAEGYKKVTLWLHADTREELERIAVVLGCSKDEAASRAINHCLATPPPEKPRKAPAAAPEPAFGPVRAKPGDRLKKR